MTQETSLLSHNALLLRKCMSKVMVLFALLGKLSIGFLFCDLVVGNINLQMGVVLSCLFSLKFCFFRFLIGSSCV